MNIKFIKDLDKLEMGYFKKSSLFSTINKNGILTTSNIKYNSEYFNGNYSDFSLVVFKKHTFFIAMISFSKDDTLSFFGEAIHIYDSNDNSVDLNLAYNIFFKKILSFKKEFSFSKLYFIENEKILSKFFDKLISNSFDYQIYIDLSQSNELIKSNVRKSYKSLINWGSINLETKLIDSNNPNKIEFDTFRDFHIKISGRKTRSDKSWELQFDSVLKNEAYLVLGYFEGKLVSGAYIAHGTETAYYGVAVNDRDLMSQNLPIGHYVLFKSILEAKKIGLSKFVLGNLNFQNDDKANAILKFKKGFTNTITSKPKYLIDI